MNRQQWMAALIWMVLPCVPVAAQGEQEPGPIDAPAEEISLSGTTFDVSLFDVCGGPVLGDMASATFEFEEGDEESGGLLTGPATVTLTDQASATTWTGQWCALDFGSAALWLLGANAGGDRLLAFGVQFDSFLMGRAHASGALSGNFHLLGMASEGGNEGPGEPPGEDPMGQPPGGENPGGEGPGGPGVEGPGGPGGPEGGPGENPSDPTGRPGDPTGGEIPGPVVPNPGPSNRGDVRRFR